jgi:hypothetical protein
LLGLTNANNDTGNAAERLVVTLKTYVVDPVWKSLNGESNETTTNGSSNATDTSVFHKPKNMSDIGMILLAFLRLLAQLFLIVSDKKMSERFM